MISLKLIDNSKKLLITLKLYKILP